jgi:hypothetical protein
MNLSYSFYINFNTNESTWTLPASTPVQNIVQPPQRKPVPTQTSLSRTQTAASCIENYPTPPLQVSTGYFPPSSMGQQHQQPQYGQASVASQQLQQPQPQHAQFPVAFQHQQSPQQQYPQNLQQQPQCAQTQGLMQQQYSTVPQHQSPASFQQQQRNYTPPSATLTSASPQYPQQILQTLSPPPTPNAQKPQQPTNYAPSSYAQSQAYPQPTAAQLHQFSPQQQATPTYHAQQANTFAQPPAQYQNQQNSFPTQPKPSSMMGSSFASGNMMNKMSSKFTQLQKGVAGPPSAAHPNGKPADWKKWSKRAAIGVAGIGAIALGVDAAGDMFSGAEGLMSSGGGDFTGGGDFSGGGDFTGGDFSGGDAAAVADAQTAVDANYMEHAIAGMGQDNAVMLTDPVGTTCTYRIFRHNSGMVC